MFVTTNRKGDMATITGNREIIIKDIAAAITEANLLWESGRAASPDTRDYVRLARQVLAKYPDFIGTTDEGEEFVADVLWQDAGQNYGSSLEVAGFLYDQLTAE